MFSIISKGLKDSQLKLLRAKEVAFSARGAASLPFVFAPSQR